MESQFLSLTPDVLLAGMSNQLFVSKYQMQLPGKEEMQRFVEEQIRKELGGGMKEGG